MAVKNRKVRIYQPGNYQVGDQVLLTPEAAHHVAIVLRLLVKQTLILFNGDNYEYSATICSIHKRNVTVDINSAVLVNKESSCQIHLAQAITKGDRMEWVIQKAVELGVSSITPLISERCSVKCTSDWLDKKQQQWQNIAIAACEQSGRNTLPLIKPTHSLQDYVQNLPATCNFMLHPAASVSWRDYQLGNDVSVLIGPEGGLSEKETIFLQDHNFLPLMLGPRVLRAETAAIAAISVLQAQAGDL